MWQLGNLGWIFWNVILRFSSEGQGTRVLDKALKKLLSLDDLFD